MPKSNLLDVQLEHDKWATRQILLACEKLTPEQFARKFEMGRGSLQATTTHIIGAMNSWSDILAERTVRTRVDQSGVVYSPADLLAMLDVTTDEFALLAREYPLDGTVKRTRDGKQYTFTRGAVLVHVTTHGMHHRAQCLNMLRQVGVKPLPLSSVIEWVWTVDSPQ